MGWATIFDWGVEAHRRLARAEMDVVGAVLADPARLMPVAMRCGVSAGAFGQEDMLAIFLACRLRYRRGLIEVLAAAREHLRRLGMWDPSAPWWERRVWSEENLVHLATAWPPSEQAVEAACRRLLRFRQRMAEAQTCWNRMRWLLNDAIEDWASWVGDAFYGEGLKRRREPRGER